MKLERNVRVQTQFEGYHRWRSAPEEVKFLRDVHRHIFRISILLEVQHEDREVEFIMLKRYLDQGCIAELRQLFNPIHSNEASCEWIAEYIGKHIQAKYGTERNIAVEVSEDGENGAFLAWTA